MRTVCVLAAVALAILAGCGDDADTDSQQGADALAKQMSTWRFAALSYNQLLQTCQVTAGERVIPTCTRKWRVAYGRETARLRQALRSQRGSSPECQRAVAEAESLVDELTRASSRAYGAFSAAELARESGREYRGPAVIPLLARLKGIARRDGARAQSLTATIRESCAS